MKPIDPTLRNASVVLAGGACIVPVLTRVFSPFYDLMPVRGAWLANLLVMPMLCLWCGMLVHYRIDRKARVWSQVVAAVIAAVMFYFSRHSVEAPSMEGWAAYYLLSFFLGWALPWDHIRENGDHVGVKSTVLVIFTALGYTALDVVWQRLIIGPVMAPECDDMRQFLLILTTNILPLAMIPPLVMAVEFAFSKAGQWLGSRKWFLWLTFIPALFCFVRAWDRIPGGFYLDLSWETAYWIRFLVQPISVYLMIVIWRLAVRLFKGCKQDYPKWKDIFKV